MCSIAKNQNELDAMSCAIFEQKPFKDTKGDFANHSGLKGQRHAQVPTENSRAFSAMIFQKEAVATILIFKGPNIVVGSGGMRLS
jgi:hypothetical protein